MLDDPNDQFEDEGPSDEDEVVFGEYDITTTPNDFNVSTIINFISRGVLKIPGFQRNYVWEIKRASKLIESLILGLPVPQIFLYEKSRNEFLVIDGQQRLMSIYYFMKKRFPRMAKRGEIRRLSDSRGAIPDQLIENDQYFERFSLRLPSGTNEPNRLNGLNYGTLGDERDSFDLKTIRCVIIRQNSPKSDDSSVYEIFSRLNTGGVNLSAQELRSSLYHSPFYEMIHRVNTNRAWRQILGIREPDLRMKDIEVLVRSVGVATSFDQYKSSMSRFLNEFSKGMKDAPDEYIVGIEKVLCSFFEKHKDVNGQIFRTRSRVNVPLVEAVIATSCSGFVALTGNARAISESRIEALRDDETFRELTAAGSTHKGRIQGRLDRAKKVLLG